MKVVLTRVPKQRNLWIAEVAFGKTTVVIDGHAIALDDHLLAAIEVAIEPVRWQAYLNRALNKLNAKAESQAQKIVDPWKYKCDSLAVAQRLREKRQPINTKGKRFNGLYQYPTDFWGTPRLETGSALKRMVNQANNRQRRQSADDWKKWCDNAASNTRKRT